MAEALEFYKMTGDGNDFILADNRQGGLSDQPADRLARGLCRRALSVGADGLILLEPSNKANFKLRILNADGSPSPMCGNGARCAAKYAFVKVIAGRKMAMETDRGVISAEVLPDGAVRVGVPGTTSEPTRLTLSVDGKEVPGLLTEAGVPHFVVLVRNVERVPVQSLGAKLRHSPALGPGGANVDFVSLAGGAPFSLRTYERGVEGETLACGTGAAATAWVLHSLGHTDSPVRIKVRSGGILTVDVSSPPLFKLEGEARVVYVGSLTRSSLEEALSCS